MFWNKNKFIGLIATSLLVVSLICVSILFKKDSVENKGHLGQAIEVHIGQNVIEAEVANTEDTIIRGLSGREKLGDRSGLLFIFVKPGNYGFWMKDMNFPIDIIWLDENKKIVFIKKDAAPSSFPEVFYPNSLSVYVLEVISGFSEKNNLKNGDQIYF